MGGTKLHMGIKNVIHNSQLASVMLSSRDFIPSNLSAAEKGADGYLLIPLDEAELQAVLKNLIGIKQKLRGNSASFTLPEIRYNNSPGQDDRFIQKILSLLDANLDNDQFGIVELCYALGMSRAQIYRKFKSITDRTPHNYLRSYRLQRAKELLLASKLNVSEAAYRTGFKNVSHFSRIFTEEFGKSPGEISI